MNSKFNSRGLSNSTYVSDFAGSVIVGGDEFLRKDALEGLALTTFFVLLSIAVPYGSTGALLILGLWGCAGLDSSIKALAISFVVRFLNPGFNASPGMDTLFGWILFMVACVRIWQGSDWRRGSSVLMFLMLFAISIATTTYVISSYPTISYFKLMSFTLIASVAMLAYPSSLMSYTQWIQWFVGNWFAVVLLSVVMIAFPSIAYLRDGRGFQGILNHPQALSVFLAPITAYLAGLTFTLRKSANYIVPALFVTSALMILSSRGRTGLVAIIAGLGLTAIAISIRGDASRNSIVRIISNGKLWFLVILCMVASLVYFDTISAKFIEFAFKGLEGSDLRDVFQSSRGFLIQQEYDNFLKNPVFGIGFGISESATRPFKPVMDPYTGIAFSAPIEKGNMLVAILEETGIFGACCFLPFFLSLIVRIAKCKNVPIVWMGATAICTNIGEVTFFSAGGIGLYLWLLIGLSAGRLNEGQYRKRSYSLG